MELWIRSQDKMVLTRNVGLRIVIEQEGASIIDETNDYILGMYNTEKRALEILNEIQNILIDYKNMSRVVYEMPKE